MRILDNAFGVFCYLILRNDWSWSMLSSREKEVILVANRSFNVDRDDYANPELYGTGRVDGGENWDSPADRSASIRGRALLGALSALKPESVLEVGPGPGFFSRTICDFPSVRAYTAVDIGQEFLRYLEPRLKKIQGEKAGFQYHLRHGLLSSFAPEKCDLVVLLSCVHHIPDREEFFRDLVRWVKPGGGIFCFDPSHYLSRWLRLLRMMPIQYLRRDFYMNRANLSTHHFCTIGEYRKIVRQIPELEIAREFYVPANRLARLPWIAKLFPRLVSIEMGVLLRRKNS